MSFSTAIYDLLGSAQGAIGKLSQVRLPQIDWNWVTRLKEGVDVSRYAGLVKTIDWGHSLTVGTGFVRGHATSLSAASLCSLGLGYSSYQFRQLRSAQHEHAQIQLIPGLLGQLRNSLSENEESLLTDDLTLRADTLTPQILAAAQNRQHIQAQFANFIGEARTTMQPVREALTRLDLLLQEKSDVHQLLLRKYKEELRGQLLALCQALDQVQGPRQQAATRIREALEAQFLPAGGGEDPLDAISNGAELAAKAGELHQYLMQQMAPVRDAPFGLNLQRTREASATARQFATQYLKNRRDVTVYCNELRAYLRDNGSFDHTQHQGEFDALVNALPATLDGVNDLSALLTTLQTAAQRLNARLTAGGSLTGKLKAGVGSTLGVTTGTATVPSADLVNRCRTAEHTKDGVKTAIRGALNELLTEARRVREQAAAAGSPNLEGLDSLITEITQDLGLELDDNLLTVVGQRFQFVSLIEGWTVRFQRTTQAASVILGDVLNYRPKVGAQAPDGLYELMQTLLGVENIEHTFLRLKSEAGVLRIPENQMRREQGKCMDLTVPIFQVRTILDDRIQSNVADLKAALEAADVAQDLLISGVEEKIAKMTQARILAPALFGILGGALALGIPYALPHMPKLVDTLRGHYSRLSERVIVQINQLRPR